MQTTEWLGLCGGFFFLGASLGAVGMVAHYENRPKPQPVIVEIEKARPASVDFGKLEQHFIKFDVHLAKIDQAITKQNALLAGR